MRNKLLIGLIFVLVVIVIGFGIYYLDSGLGKNKISYGDDGLNGKLRMCPDEWVKNEMPCVCNGEDCSACDNPSREYFIINDTRRELTEFDTEWIKENCNIQPKVVY